MKYTLYLSARAKKQFKRFDAHIRNKLKTELLELEEDPFEKGNIIQGISHGLCYVKIFYAGVQYRAVYDVAKNEREVLIIFVGSRENFYKELRRFLV